MSFLFCFGFFCFNNKIDDDYKTFTRRFDALKRHFQEL